MPPYKAYTNVWTYLVGSIMRFNTVLVILLIAIEQQVGKTARILSIFGFEGPAQYAFVEALLRGLGERGHYVTSITNFPQNSELPNLRPIVIKENFNLYEKFKQAASRDIDMDHFNRTGEIFTIGFQMSENILGNVMMRHLMKNEKFDLILMNLLFSESLYGLAQHFDAPIVGICTIGSSILLDAIFRNPAPLSYVPSVLMTHRYDENMNFWERCLNVALFVLGNLYYDFEIMPLNREYYKLRFPNSTRSVEEIKRNVSLVLLNDHHAISTPKPYLPNMIEVAGLHIPEAFEPLPPHIVAMLNKTASKGFIYVAMKTHFPDDVMQEILIQFGMLKQVVLWNAVEYPSPLWRIPSNVYFFTNLSHHAILGHPNCRLLVSHGCYFSVIESIHYGVPILGLKSPYFQTGEIFNFIQKLNTGISLKIGPKSLRDNEIYKAAVELVENDIYLKMAKMKSFQFRDRQNTPMQTAIYWIEYTLRHRGAPHLRHLGHNLNSWEFNNADVYLFIFLGLMIVFRIFNIILNISIKLIKHMCCKQKYKIA